MAITVQARQADGTWSVRSAFIDENKLVIAGTMKSADLEAKARALMSRWQVAMQDGKQLRVHNSDNDPVPTKQNRRAQSEAETTARSLGWVTNREMHGEHVEGYGVVHPNGHWAKDWNSAATFHDALDAVA